MPPAAYKPWMIGPFHQVDSANPVLGPNFDSLFFCPIRKQNVRWEARALLGATAVVKDDRLDLIYHAEDSSNGFRRADLYLSPGTMRMGFATSTDGLQFTRNNQPVLYPDNGPLHDAEWPGNNRAGGDEIPRMVEGPDKTYYLYYSSLHNAPDYLLTRLTVATSKDLVHWTKRGLAFAKADGGKYERLWSKSGAVVTEIKDGRLIAAKIKGKYWMYFGEGNMHVATSDNLLDWTPVVVAPGQRNVPAESDNVYDRKSSEWPELLNVQYPRKHMFDSALIEGGVAVLTKDGIVHMYNSEDVDSPDRARWNKEARQLYSVGQALFSADDPTRLLDRSDTAFLTPDAEFEKYGISPYTVFLTGIAWYHGKWFLYFNGADWMIGAATTL